MAFSPARASRSGHNCTPRAPSLGGSKLRAEGQTLQLLRTVGLYHLISNSSIPQLNRTVFPICSPSLRRQCQHPHRVAPKNFSRSRRQAAVAPGREPTIRRSAIGSGSDAEEVDPGRGPSRESKPEIINPLTPATSHSAGYPPRACLLRIPFRSPPGCVSVLAAMWSGCLDVRRQAHLLLSHDDGDSAFGTC